MKVGASLVNQRLLGVMRPVLGPPSRRLRRQVQWRSVRDILARDRVPEPLAHIVSSHHTPLIRVLPGVDPVYQHNKVINLRIAVGELDGLVVKPGQVFSFWRLVGPPRARRGFVDGIVLDHGRVSVGVGGGLCQLTNLIYWMTLHTPLEVTERWRHSYDVFPDSDRSQPFGSGATCAWPLLDLQITNPTGAVFRLGLKVGDTDLAGEWTSDVESHSTYAIEERHHRVSHEGPGVHVRHNELWRIESGPAGTVLSERMVAENHALMMYEPFLGPGART
ncbi:MAG: VanW family protein [Anaerosomatales bacterium]